MLLGLFVILVALLPGQIIWRNFHFKLTNHSYVIYGINWTEQYPSTQPVGMDKKERKKERKKIPEIPDYLVEPKNELRWKFQQRNYLTRLQGYKDDI